MHYNVNEHTDFEVCFESYANPCSWRKHTDFNSPQLFAKAKVGSSSSSTFKMQTHTHTHTRLLTADEGFYNYSPTCWHIKDAQKWLDDERAAVASSHFTPINPPRTCFPLFVCFSSCSSSSSSSFSTALLIGGNSCIVMKDKKLNAARLQTVEKFRRFFFFGHFFCLLEASRPQPTGTSSVLRCKLEQLWNNTYTVHIR